MSIVYSDDLQCFDCVKWKPSQRCIITLLSNCRWLPSSCPSFFASWILYSHMIYLQCLQASTFRSICSSWKIGRVCHSWILNLYLRTSPARKATNLSFHVSGLEHMTFARSIHSYKKKKLVTSAQTNLKKVYHLKIWQQLTEWLSAVNVVANLLLNRPGCRPTNENVPTDYNRVHFILHKQRLFVSSQIKLMNSVRFWIFWL